MEIQLLNKELTGALHDKARANERLRMNFDLRTTPADTSQRMLNALEVGTRVPIHRAPQDQRDGGLFGGVPGLGVL